MNVRDLIKAGLVLGAIMLAPLTLSAPAFAAQAPIYTPWHSNLAVGGYDVVSYYSGKPVKGDPQYFFDYKGAKWVFSSLNNRNLFISEPARYAPQYGGYCAWAVAMDKLAKGSAEQWSLVEGKLYLNFNARIKTRWDTDQAQFIKDADQKWPQILD